MKIPFALSPSAGSGQASRSEVEGRHTAFFNNLLGH